MNRTLPATLTLLFMAHTSWAQNTTPSAPQAPAAESGATGFHLLSDFRPLPQDALIHLDTENAEIFDVGDARALLEATAVQADMLDRADLDAKDFYAIIHVLRWSIQGNRDPGTRVQGTMTAHPGSADRWYVYHAGRWSQSDFASSNRLFGVRRVWMQFVHLNHPQADYRARYQFTVTPKQPAILANMAGLASMLFNPNLGVRGFDEAPPPPQHQWSAGWVSIPSVPSDVTIQPLRIVQGEASNSFARLAEARTFDNEGRYWLDFSVGVPIKAGKELSVDGASVAPQKVDKQNIFALVNLFPQPVDVKSAGFRRVPHLVAGVAVAKEPWHKVLVAAGWGPAFANFYLGTLLVRQPVEDASGRRWDPQLAFGLNLTVKGTKAALEKASQ